MASTPALLLGGESLHRESNRGAFSWSNVTYDIPLPKVQRKAAIAAAAAADNNVENDDEDLEKASSSATPLSKEEEDGPAPGQRRVLDAVSGSIRRGQMMAILGASGAGKTTLLNILSARITQHGSLSGQVFFEDRPRDQGTWKRTVAYVEQDDILLSYLTVYEQLLFSARVRLPSRHYSPAAKIQRVEETIKMLRLDKCRDTRIGDTNKRGVSGGERKRTSMGVELVNDSCLLLLDEPTSGLDSYTAMSVVENVREVARQRDIACVVTIHQPSWALLNLFDKVQLLASGKVYYDGPPQDMIQWFGSLNYHPAEGVNPIDYFVSIAENSGNTEAGAQRVQALIAAWAARPKEEDRVEVVVVKTPAASQRSISPMSEEPSAFVHQLENSQQIETQRHKTISSEWPTSWPNEVRELIKRNYRALTRDLLPFYASIAQVLMLLIIVGFAAFRLGYSQLDVIARIGVLFYLPVNTSFIVLFPVLAPLALDRAIMKRERSSGAYRTSSFIVAKLFVDVPSNVIRNLPLFGILYWMVGLKAQASAYFIFVLANSVQVFMAATLGLLVGSISPNIEVASLVAPLINVIFFLFGGVMLPEPPSYYIWLRYLSPISYIVSALSLNEYAGQKYECQNIFTQQCYLTGEQVLTQYKLTEFTIAENLALVVALGFGCAFLAYVALRFLSHPKFRYI